MGNSSGGCAKVTFPNADKCGTYQSCTGGDCIAGIGGDCGTSQVCVGGDCMPGIGGDCGTHQSCVGGDCMPGIGGDCGTHQVCVGGDCLSKTISATVSCPSNYVKIGGLCYSGCDAGYKYNDNNAPVSCIPNDDKGLTYLTSSTPASCNSDRDKIAALCYQRCRDGYNMVGGTCWNKKALSITITDKISLQCPDTHPDKVDGLCYKTCPSGTTRVAGAPTQCKGSHDLHYTIKTSIPQITGKSSKIPDCSSNKIKKDGLCYEICN